ncbi:DPP IV N-terminal domain-containing protein [Stakelama sediminis]|uniref:Dipeptidyl aminopeptidase/acylaminoacyl peptidase n=1 Tax=Stakelama sediminis TaxID=463200 RepID=A0A840YXY4_9SPHN|nr:DPP IV N-terminal domain-containing protein [Stakelama sediminis]MBB5718455.1 dipeptidyl aminopeptidase/acylaminoacyl peptidase [Stakelama sediminis]
MSVALGGALTFTMVQAPSAIAAAPDAKQYHDALTLRDRWEYLTRDVAFPASWLADTHDFTFRKTVAGGFAFVRENADTGKSEAAFDQAVVAVELSKATDKHYTALRLPFSDFTYSDDGKAILFDIHYDPWRCSLTGGGCAAVEEKDRPRGFGVVRDLRVPANNTPHVSPDGKWEALVQGFNLVIRPVGGGPVKILSRDGTQGDFYDPETLHWAPDSRKIVIDRVRPGFARYVTRVLSSPKDRLQPEIRKQLYPKPGDAIDLDQPVLFHVAPDGTSSQIDISNALFPNPYQLTDMHWRADSATLAFEYTRRGHQQARIIAVNADTGNARAVVSESAKTFIWQDRGYWHDVHNDGKELIWLSERDGWAHLYLYNGVTGKVENKITKGDWPVRQVIRVDDDKRQIWFAAGGMNKGEDPYFVHYYRINFDGTGLTPLTPVRADHDVSFSSDGKYYVDTYSRVDLPNIAELHRADGSLVRTIAKGDISRLTAAGYKFPQPFVAKGRDGKTNIWGLIVKPQHFDPHKKYPVIENIYAGPHDSFVPKTFWPFGYHSGGDKVIGMQELADMGFIVVQIDGMGTANRSKAFQDVAWKNLEDSGFPDRILWHKAAAAKFPWYDISHGVGIYGGSAGGQSTVSGLLFHPDFYKVGVAYAGCYDNRMDKISWNEQWLGWPVDDSYLRASDVVNASRLKGRLLMIFGEQDSNVDPSSSLQLVNALIKAHKDFDLLEVPGGEHTTGRSTGPVYYAERRQFAFFVRYLKGEATPDWNALPDDVPADGTLPGE